MKSMMGEIVLILSLGLPKIHSSVSLPLKEKRREEVRKTIT